MVTLRHSLLATLLLLAAAGASGQSAVAATAGQRLIDEADRVVLHGNVPARARPELEIGRTDPKLPMERMILALALPPGAKARRDQLLAAQQDPASPEYHRWLSPAEFGARFGPSDADIQALTGWLTSHGLTIDEVAQGRGSINFSGVVSQVEKTFATEIHDYRIAGQLHHANSVDPSIPGALSDLVTGVVSLHDFRRRPAHRVAVHPAAGPRPQTGGQPISLAPGDFATIYGLNQAYGAGIDGAGVGIALVAVSDILLSDVQTFRSTFGLPANDPVFVHNGKDPGISSGGDEGESDLDTEWAGAVAPRATVSLVISASTNSSDGSVLSHQYIVDKNVAPVASTSYGLCESETGATEISFFDALLAQGAAQGITSFSAAGDSGAADCDDPNGSRGTGRAVDYPCSSPNNTCAGGTELDDEADTSAYWVPCGDPESGFCAVSYIPEVVWNESGAASGGPCSTPDDTCAGLWATGGGASSYFTKPSWQSAPGVPADGRRDVPDVALSAAAHDGYFTFQEGQLSIFSGTSAAAPSFAGLLALVNQKLGARQGNVNSILYQLAAKQYGAGGPAVFHDITSGNNGVPGVNGYAAGRAYDQATGLGSVDGQALLAQWPTGTGGNPTPCVASATNLCLAGGRFGLTATYDAGASGAGTAQVVPVSDDTGFLWFFASSNIEVVVKVLDGCALGGHYWVFAGGLTNVDVVIKATDSQTGATRTYTNPQGTSFQPIQDTAAFSTCP